MNDRVVAPQECLGERVFAVDDNSMPPIAAQPGSSLDNPVNIDVPTDYSGIYIYVILQIPLATLLCYLWLYRQNWSTVNIMNIKYFLTDYVFIFN